jgi:hypothetical protein
MIISLGGRWKMQIKGTLSIIITVLHTAIVFAQIETNDVIRLTSNQDYIVNTMYLDGNLAPIGWSRDGKLAYAYFYGVQGQRGGVLRSGIVIVDTITDRRIEELYTEPGDGKEGNDGISFSEYWLLAQNEITILLQKYKIVSFPDMEIRDINSLKQEYGLEIEYESIDYEGNIIQDNDENYKEQHHINIYVRNSSGRRKKIGEGGNIYASAEIIGYYKSPFENRLAFYIKTRYFGGPEISEEYYRFIGCHITVGF